MNLKNKLLAEMKGALRSIRGGRAAAILAVCCLIFPGGLQAKDDELPVPATELAKLQWMVGSWTHESEGAMMKMTVTWSESRSLLQRKFEIKLGTSALVLVSQTLGWDPVAKELRSLAFSSDGNSETGVWQVDGKKVHNKCQITFADGRQGSAVHTWELDEYHQCVFTSSERKVDGKSLFDIAPTEFAAAGVEAAVQDRVAALDLQGGCPVVGE